MSESLKMTITEALAEIKTIVKRIASKREFINQYIVRYDNVKDPLAKDGGSAEAISREMQAIHDLEGRIVELRLGIQSANENTKITIEGDERSIADWLVWRREVAPAYDKFLHHLRFTLTQVRDQARRQGNSLFGPGTQPEKPNDLVVNIDEQELAKSLEKHTNILGQLDGQLSLKNATVLIG